MRMMRPQSVKGFTLVELAIALIIIALLLGGIVIGGSSMIERAKVASLIGQIKDLATASRDFKSRYGYYPGDLPNAATFIAGVSAGCSYAVAGNVGNGIVDTATENTCAIEHLIKARLLSKVDQDAAGNYVIPNPFGTGNISLSFIQASNENAVKVTNLACKIALQIDGKMDNADASPLASGFVTGWDSSNAIINTCGENDIVASLLIRY